jgi:hypothetical protein
MKQLKNVCFILLGLVLGGCAETPDGANENGDTDTASDSVADGAKGAPDQESPALKDAKDPTDGAAKKGTTEIVLPASVELVADATTLPVNRFVGLTATASIDVGPTPYWIVIYEPVTNTHVMSCGWGTTCFASLWGSSMSTSTFVAYLTPDRYGKPPAGIIAASSKRFVTWGPGTFQVSVPPMITCTSNNMVNITATANRSVSGTPYVIQIHDTNGGNLGACSSGSSCTIQTRCANKGYVAFVGANSDRLPPTTTLASSNTGKLAKLY